MDTHKLRDLLATLNFQKESSERLRGLRQDVTTWARRGGGWLDDALCNFGDAIDRELHERLLKEQHQELLAQQAAQHEDSQRVQYAKLLQLVREHDEKMSHAEKLHNQLREDAKQSANRADEAAGRALGAQQKSAWAAIASALAAVVGIAVSVWLGWKDKPTIEQTAQPTPALREQSQPPSLHDTAVPAATPLPPVQQPPQ